MHGLNAEISGYEHTGVTDRSCDDWKSGFPKGVVQRDNGRGMVIILGLPTP